MMVKLKFMYEQNFVTFNLSWFLGTYLLVDFVGFSMWSFSYIINLLNLTFWHQQIIEWLLVIREQKHTHVAQLTANIMAPFILRLER